MMIRRDLAAVLALEATRNPVLTVIGPRQSGKTTLVRALFPDHHYVSLERPDRLAAAREDPLSLLAAARGRGMILDEVQRAPELLSYIQVAVDEDDAPGRFVLTGSQNFLLMESVSQTLAGRTVLLQLQPFSITELLGRPAISTSAPLETGPPGERAPDAELWQTLWTGFYPRIHDKGLDPQRWLADYHRTYVERDLRAVLKVMDLGLFEGFVRLAAARTGCELNLSELAADAGISQPTAKQWLTALRVGSLIVTLPPHAANFRKRLRKRPKLHFLDSGLICYLLGIRDPETLASHPLRGAIFESFVVSELVKAFAHAGREPPLFHWRDATGHEVDIIVDLGERLLPIEVKSGRTLGSDALATLRWWTSLPGNDNTGGVLVHGGDERSSRQGFGIAPWYLS